MIDTKDLDVSSWSSNNHGGLSVGFPSGIKLTHLPTGITATCESERSQHLNRAKALESLEALINYHIVPILRGKPRITNRMKAENHGYHSFTISEPCPKCSLYLDEHYDNVECLCLDSDDHTYEKEIVVPWTICKEIYAAMVMSSSNEDN